MTCPKVVFSPPQLTPQPWALSLTFTCFKGDFLTLLTWANFQCY